ncbi:inositol monophosphatase family protein [Oceanobacillus arenosus]|uniref:inositol monophosphatase family protein n=1 Tax=Oceanobacillus arenosus TaxID=1229153 RepID=UPI001475E1D1|nr:inositol monophosphatase family protein [Oceanobacillus arenosus]
MSDATAAPGKDAFNTGVVNLGFISSGVWTIQVAIERLNAYLNGEPIRVGSESNISDALLVTGFQAPEWNSDSAVLEQIGNLIGKSRSVRIFGAASLDLCMVATGQLTGFFHDGLHPWDDAAGVIILQEAGGTVTNREGESFRLSDDTLVASNQLIHDSLIVLLN